MAGKLQRKLKNSYWILWTYTLILNWIAFFYIGFRVRQRKWIFAGLLYSLPFCLGMLFADGDQNPANDHWMMRVAVFLTVISGVVSIIHAHSIRNEYLIRLGLLEEKEEKSKAELRQEIAQEHGNHIPDNPSLSRLFEKKTVPEIRAHQEEKPRAKIIDLNMAAEEELASLPGFGPVLAKRAVQLRKELGGFQSFEEFTDLLQLKPHIVVKIKPLVTVTPPRKKGSQNFSQGRMVDF